MMTQQIRKMWLERYGHEPAAITVSFDGNRCEIKIIDEYPPPPALWFWREDDLIRATSRARLIGR